MMETRLIKQWIATLSDTTQLAVDDGGLTIVELTSDGKKETGAYIELGGIPLPDEGKE